MDTKDYIEIFDENGSRKMEIVLAFNSPTDSEYKYVIYKEFEDSKELFAGKIKDDEEAILETVLSDEEIKLVEKVYTEAIKSI